MTNRTSNRGRYEVKEHIDFCFTCISKTLILEEQIAIILKGIYAFSRTEITDILGKTEGVVKHSPHKETLLISYANELNFL